MRRWLPAVVVLWGPLLRGVTDNIDVEIGYGVNVGSPVQQQRLTASARLEASSSRFKGVFDWIHVQLLVFLGPVGDGNQPLSLNRVGLGLGLCARLLEFPLDLERTPRV